MNCSGLSPNLLEYPESRGYRRSRSIRTTIEVDGRWYQSSLDTSSSGSMLRVPPVSPQREIRKHHLSMRSRDQPFPRGSRREECTERSSSWAERRRRRIGSLRRPIHCPRRLERNRSRTLRAPSTGRCASYRRIDPRESCRARRVLRPDRSSRRRRRNLPRSGRSEHPREPSRAVRADRFGFEFDSRGLPWVLTVTNGHRLGQPSRRDRVLMRSYRSPYTRDRT